MKNSAFDEEMVKHIRMYVDNTRSIYCLTEWLTNCVTKRMAKGMSCTLEALANCSTMRKIINMGSNDAIYYDKVQITQADKREARRRHAVYILECANYLKNA